jgi:hypothetical protein
MAIPSASVSSAAMGEESIDQPTTRRENASSTTAWYTFPSRVECSEGAPPVRGNISDPQPVLRGLGEATIHQVGGDRVPFGAAPLRATGHPLSSARRMSSSTVPRETARPRPKVSSAWTRRLPYVSREMVWTWRVASLSSAWRTWRAEKPGSSRRSSQKPRRPAPGWRPRCSSPLQPSPRSLRSALWGHHLPQQLTGPPMHRQFRLHLRDASLRGAQFGQLASAGSRHQSVVDTVLSAPGGDRLRTDPQERCDFGYRPVGLDQVQHLATELSRVSTSSHTPFPGFQRP